MVQTEAPAANRAKYTSCSSALSSTCGRRPPCSGPLSRTHASTPSRARCASRALAQVAYTRNSLPRQGARAPCPECHAVRRAHQVRTRADTYTDTEPLHRELLSSNLARTTNEQSPTNMANMGAAEDAAAAMASAMNALRQSSAMGLPSLVFGLGPYTRPTRVCVRVCVRVCGPPRHPPRASGRGGRDGCPYYLVHASEPLEYSICMTEYVTISEPQYVGVALTPQQNAQARRNHHARTPTPRRLKNRTAMGAT